MSGAAAEIERLLAEADELPDPRARALARSLAAAMIELVGDGLHRIGGMGGPALVRAMADDELVGNLLVLCGQHPDPPAARAARALEAARAELAAAGVSLEGVDVDEMGGGVRVRLGDARGGAAEVSAARADRVRALVEAIVVGRAPDVEAVEVELGGAVLAPPGFVPLARLRGAP
ncbi:MAG TPA: hypothetical protein VNO30_24775 [Kofleriaceae bacterium]|nr:hypothetical protein [Kofleriaceae bacterium]